MLDWNTYAIVAIIELARGKSENPDVPQWIADDYFHAIAELAKIGTTEVLRAKNPENVRAILGVIAIEKGLRTPRKVARGLFRRREAGHRILG